MRGSYAEADASALNPDDAGKLEVLNYVVTLSIVKLVAPVLKARQSLSLGIDNLELRCLTYPMAKRDAVFDSSRQSGTPPNSSIFRTLPYPFFSEVYRFMESNVGLLSRIATGDK